MHLLMSRDHSLKIRMGNGHSTNNYVKLVALWLLLYMAMRRNICELQIFGDSRVVIDWFNQVAGLHAINLAHWSKRIWHISSLFGTITCGHIYQELNGVADCLSKEALSGIDGRIIWKEYRDSGVIEEGDIHIL